MHIEANPTGIVCTAAYCNLGFTKSLTWSLRRQDGEDKTADNNPTWRFAINRLD